MDELKPLPARETFTVLMQINLPIPSFEIGKKSAVQRIISHPIPLKMKDAILAYIDILIKDKIEKYFDQDRELKTLVNFGNEFQSLMLNWKYDATDLDGWTVVGKLYKPLPPEIQTNVETATSSMQSSEGMHSLFPPHIVPATNPFRFPLLDASQSLATVEPV